MRIGAGTGGRSCAARELRIESLLRVARGDVVETDIRQRAAVENDAAYGLGVSTHVRLSERGAVGAAEEIDLAVPKRATHDLQVVCSHTRRVEPRICVERGETASEITGHSGRIRSPHVSRGAGKTARAARATLVDHDEIAVSLDLREEGIHPGRSCRRRATRPALEIEQRARGRPLRRRQHRDLQGDHPAVRLTRILRNAQVCAPAVDIAAVRARGKMRLTARRMPRPGTPREPEHKATEPGDGEDREHRPDPTRQAAAGRPPIFAPTTQKRIVRSVTHRSRARSERCETSKSAVLRARTGTFRRGYRSRRHRFPNSSSSGLPRLPLRRSRLAIPRDRAPMRPARDRHRAGQCSPDPRDRGDGGLTTCTHGREPRSDHSSANSWRATTLAFSRTSALVRSSGETPLSVRSTSGARADHAASDALHSTRATQPHALS